jgi:hypothetical protein
MWWWLKLGWRLRKLKPELEAILRMKFSLNAVVQLLALAGQGIVQVQDMLPPKGKFWAAVALAGVQGVVGVLAHFANPDGTPAALPYQEKKQ